MEVVRESLNEYNVCLMHELPIITNFPLYPFFFENQSSSSLSLVSVNTESSDT